MSDFDASVGLELSLQLCQRHKKNGTLSARVRGVRNMRGEVLVTIVIEQGTVISCTLEDQYQAVHMGDIKQLVALDNAQYGRIRWSFVSASPKRPTNPVPAVPGKTTFPWSARPQRKRDQIPDQQLQGFTPNAQQSLIMVFAAVNGVDTFEVLVQRTRIPRSVFEQAASLLLRAGYISY